MAIRETNEKQINSHAKSGTYRVQSLRENGCEVLERFLLNLSFPSLIEIAKHFS